MLERRPLIGVTASLAERPADPRRNAIDRLLPWRLSDTEWQFVGNRFRLMLNDSRHYVHIAAEVETSRDAFGSDRHPRLQLRRGSLPARHAALTALVAFNAAQRADVQQFRRVVLKGKLLPISGVEQWLLEMHAKPAPKCLVEAAIDCSRIRATATSPPKLTIDPPLNRVDYWHFEYLDYLVLENEESGFLRRIPASGGILWRLREISLRLSEVYTWEPAVATTFVVSDLLGIFPNIASEINFRLERHSLPALNRIILDVSPSAKAKDVISQYRALRKQHYGSRYRSMTDRDIQLALFYAQNAASMTFKEMMAAWNKRAQKEWRYAALQDFTKQASEARYRVEEGRWK